ncbi:hypothetical protein B0H14DRAFT_2350425, partial [Mycena olivaceomarginata]
ENLNKLFDLLNGFLWTLGEALHYLFAHKDSDNLPVHRSRRHGNIVETVSGILEAWLTGPDGCGFADEMLFDTETPYLSVRPVRQALTAFAAQTCSNFLDSESRSAVKPSGGLWAEFEPTNESEGAEAHVTKAWEEMRTALQQAANNICKNQRLAKHFMHIIAEPKPRSRKGIITIRKSRPRENVWLILSHCRLMK